MTQTAILKGNLGKDPEVRTTTSGAKVVTFSIATYRPNPKEKDKPLTDWFNCVAVGDQADIVEQNFKKGTSVYLFGKFRTRNYDDKDGKKVYVTEFWLDECGLALKKKNDSVNESGSIHDDSDLPF